MAKEETQEKIASEKILCDSCEWYLLKGNKPKCKYVKEKDRLNMIQSGIQCPEYLLAHRLQVE